jgi:hypothetical protein
MMRSKACSRITPECEPTMAHCSLGSHVTTRSFVDLVFSPSPPNLNLSHKVPSHFAVPIRFLPRTGRDYPSTTVASDSMSSAAESCFKALLALSGNPAVAEMRKALLANIRDGDLERLVKHAIAREFGRKDSETIVLTILDIVAAETRAAETGRAQAETTIKSEGQQEADIQASNNGMAPWEREDQC